jgi:MarR family transcriptional regulator, transcriptional regulator for hemolysin
MASGVRDLGYEDYRRSDAAIMRRLRQGPLSIGQLGTALGTSRQAARKVADGLEQRGLATMERDPDDTRQVNVLLTAEGEAYAAAVAKVIERLNRNLSRRVGAADLVGADKVLRAVLSDDRTRRVAENIPGPGDVRR